MTVVYTNEVATGKSNFFGNFFRLLFRWRGSIYKVVIVDCVIYALMYAIVSLTYRLWLLKSAEVTYKENFEKLVRYCGDYAGLIPVSFVLGFYVAQIVTRWWNQFLTIPWPDGLSATLAFAIHGDDERARMMKRTIVRYINCTFVLTLVSISPQVKARFPTMDHIVEAGLMMPHERIIFEHLNANTDYPKYWIPIVWALNIASRARLENRISHDVMLVNVCNLILRFRTGCGDLLGYDWVCIPLVYTQVVTLAVHLYFAAALFGKQFISDEHEIDLYVPIFLFLEFFFYMGWLKVAETMVNPFGEDDDDFEVNWLIDRNFSVSHLMVEMGQDFPHLTKDMYWELGVPDGLPYTKAAEKFRTGTHLGSAYLQEVEVSDYLEPPNDNLKDQKEGPSLFSSNRGAGARKSRSRTGTIDTDPGSARQRRDIGINLDPDTIQANIDQDKKPFSHLMEPAAVDPQQRLTSETPETNTADVTEEVNLPKTSSVPNLVEEKEKPKQERGQIRTSGVYSDPTFGVNPLTERERAEDQAKKYSMKKP